MMNPNDYVLKKQFEYYSNLVDRLKDQETEYSKEDLISILDRLYKDLEHYKSLPPTEYTNGIISKIVRGIIETFIRIFNNFRAVITSFHKSVKRSELEYFIQSHPILVRSVEKKNYLDIENVEIPTPPFKQPVTRVSKDFISFYKNLKVKQTSKDIYSTVDSIVNSFLKEDKKENITTNINKLHSLCNNKYCQSVIKYLVQTVDIRPSNLATTFGKVFNNIRELVTIKKELLSYETNLYNEASYASSMVNKCDKVLTRFEKKIEDTVPDYIVENKDILKKFADVLHELGYYFETVGTYAKEVNHLSHFLVNVYKSVDNASQ